jgi:hypothetical protein
MLTNEFVPKEREILPKVTSPALLPRERGRGDLPGEEQEIPEFEGFL